MTMTSRASLASAVLLVSLAAAPAHPQQQQPPPAPQPQRAPGAIQEGVRAVLVDVVVRDRRGQPVLDLTQADFEILEDGVAQTLGSFSPMFERASGAAPSAPAEASASAAAGAAASALANGPAVTALVFDRLQPESRRRAAQAARNYLGAKEESADYVAVFGIDIGMTAFVPFTRNAVALRKALDAMVTGASTGFTSPESRQAIADATALAKTAAQNATNAIAGAAAAGSAAAAGTAPADAILTEMQASMMKGFEAMDRDHEGYATTNGLFTIVNTLGRIPGRKSIILFSEGISIPPAVHRFYLGVIDAANRANVSIYTMDAAGLRATSDVATMRDAINAQAGVGINTGYAAEGAGGAYTRGLEDNEYNLRGNPAYTLNELSNSTGGLFFNNTNNLKPAFERVQSDQHNYYLIGYTPANTKYDGRFRKIDVRVKRDNVTVASRKGYYAVRDPGGAPVNDWEAPALGALEQTPVGNAFPIRAGAMLFPERGRPGLVPVVVDLKTAPLSFQTTSDGKSYASDFTVLVRFVDSQNVVARKVSQHYEIRGPVAEVERAKLGDVVFYRESELPAGTYTMETIVYDAPSGKSSVRFSTVEVPKYDDNSLRMSSLVLVKRSEKLAEKDRRGDHPLVAGAVMLQPNLGETVSKASKELPFYFTLYPVPGGPAPESSIELLLNGQLVARVAMPVGAADKSGRVQQVGRLPLDQIAPGTYEIRAIGRQGSSQVARSTLVRIEP